MSHATLDTSLALAFKLSPAVIHVRNLRLRTYIGFNPEELIKQQDIIINASIYYDAKNACNMDDEHEALNYKLLTKNIISHVEQGNFRLLEKLASDLINIIMRHPQVLRAEISVDKPHALRFADSVSLTLSASRNKDTLVS